MTGMKCDGAWQTSMGRVFKAGVQLQRKPSFWFPPVKLLLMEGHVEGALGDCNGWADT